MGEGGFCSGNREADGREIGGIIVKFVGALTPAAILFPDRYPLQGSSIDAMTRLEVVVADLEEPSNDEFPTTVEELS